jgi:DNA-binding response OmpR family regulator
MDAPEQVKPITVLLIDDDELIRQSIATYLDDSGFDILQADNGRAGMQMIHQTTPDVVLLDLRMPELDGLEVLDQIKQEDPELPVIVVTGAGVLKDAVEALRMGAFDFISKPIIDMAFLENAINKAVERTRMRHEIRCYREHLEAEISKRTGELEQRSAELERSNRQLQSEMLEKQRTQTALSRSESQLADIIAVFEGFIYTVNRSYELQFVNPKLMAYSEPAKPAPTATSACMAFRRLAPGVRSSGSCAGTPCGPSSSSLHDGRWYYGVYSPQENISGATEGVRR